MGSPLLADLGLPDICLQGVRLLDPCRQRDGVADVWLRRGRLLLVEATAIPAKIPRLDAAGWVLGPGLIDLYTSSGELGRQWPLRWPRDSHFLGSSGAGRRLYPSWPAAHSSCGDGSLSRAGSARAGRPLSPPAWGSPLAALGCLELGWAGRSSQPLGRAGPRWSHWLCDPAWGSRVAALPGPGATSSGVLAALEQAPAGLGLGSHPRLVRAVSTRGCGPCGWG
jgi:hypothetical protein